MKGAVFVGRSEEVARGQRAIDAAARGEGALVCFTGEAGIGKTRLADAVAGLAAERGARLAWGRCWEAGGAPAYWPFIQVFRALGVEEDLFSTDGAEANADVRLVRFRQFDRAVARLKALASEELLAIVLDDLHMADVPSLLLLHFLARDMRGARLLVICTHRDVEARLAPEIGGLLAKIAREGDAMALGRLSRDDVLAWLRAERMDAGEDVAERVHRTTEGNALFVHELLRVRGTPSEGAMPDGLRAVLDEHLARLTPEVRAVVEAASILGRDIDARAAAELCEAPVARIEACLREACEAGVLSSPSGGNRLAFAHILLRERLYEALGPERRATLHLRAGEWMLAGRGDLATAAHHLVEGRSAGSPLRAAGVLRDAAAAANARLAFEDAARLGERALDALREERTEPGAELACDLEILVGEARLRAGDSAAGKEACLRAFAQARALGAPERIATAALVHATDLATGRVDRAMVSMLREALEALPDADSPIRARVMARYAAARVPPEHADEVAPVLALARDACAMADRIGDTETKVYVYKFASSASGYLVSSRERLEQVTRLMALVDQVDRPTELLNVAGWWMAGLRENGDIAGSEHVFARFERLIADFPQPHYRWRLSMLRAMRAMLAGELDEAERLGHEALAIDGDSPLCAMHWAFHRFGIAHVRDDPSWIEADGDRVFSLLRRIPGANPFAAWHDAVIGRKDEARRRLEEVIAIEHSFVWAIIGAEVACLLGDRDLVERLYTQLRVFVPTQVAFWGSHGSLLFGPTARIAAKLAASLGKVDEARELYEEAIRVCERMAAVPYLELSKKGLAALGEAAPVSRAPASRRPEAITLLREGDVWKIGSSTGITMRLKDAKGLQYLADLLARPGEDLHVTQLAELADKVTGDAGPVLDARAKAAYKQRLEALRDELEEATRFGDPARSARAQEEIDAIADQLASAVGIGGRDRKVGSHVERARINVQRRLKDAIARIEEHDPALGKYLSAAVKTGTYCSFTPF